jgi:hypothetical protein
MAKDDELDLAPEQEEEEEYIQYDIATQYRPRRNVYRIANWQIKIGDDEAGPNARWRV